MALSKEEMLELAEIVANSVVKALRDNGLFGNANSGNGGNAPKCKSKSPAEKSAYQKTEQLLFRYNRFKQIVEDKRQEIEDLRKFGVPGKSLSIVPYSPHSGTVQGTVLPDEAVECAVRTVEDSVQGIVQVIAMIDKGLAALSDDPYYKILELRYFEGRTHEDIGVYFNCDHSTISRNKSRLVQELAILLFPNDVVGEFIGCK